MPEIIARLRWFPVGPTAGPKVPILAGDVEEIARRCGVNIACEEVAGKDRREVGPVVYEDTMGRAIAEISQTVVTISTTDEAAFRKAVRALVRKYRAPRTTFATLGSNALGQKLATVLFDEDDGWQ